MSAVRGRVNMREVRALLTKVKRFRKEAATARDNLRAAMSEFEAVVESFEGADEYLDSGIADIQRGIDRMSENV